MAFLHPHLNFLSGAFLRPKHPGYHHSSAVALIIKRVNDVVKSLFLYAGPWIAIIVTALKSSQTDWLCFTYDATPDHSTGSIGIDFV